MKLAERSIEQERKSGGTVQSEVVIERPTLNGGLQMAERRVAESRGNQEQGEREETVYRPDFNGRLSEAERQVVRQKTENGRAVEQSDEYLAAADGSGLKLTKQTVSRTVLNADGSQSRQVDVFGPAAPGRPVSREGLQLRERFLIDRKMNPDGSAIETTRVQRPSVTNANELGPAYKVAETVCKGSCAPAKQQP
jgi:hypothetical protein